MPECPDDKLALSLPECKAKDQPRSVGLFLGRVMNILIYEIKIDLLQDGDMEDAYFKAASVIKW